MYLISILDKGGNLIEEVTCYNYNDTEIKGFIKELISKNEPCTIISEHK
jgi:hypothetical protein